ncbi:hypothetical protein [Aquimarina macrocephali]|uniref:hypothetical protein n=1 Tax=Aquimarina macrocephali TaxID=666563 RepID=UPI003F6712EE
MTKAEKQHKLKLISLIILVNTEYARRKPFKDIWKTLAFAHEQVWWARQAVMLSYTPTFEKGGIAVIGENKESEVNLPRNNFK